MHGCCTPRQFPTKGEQIEKLKKYKDDLENEAKGVTEEISRLQKEN